MAQRIAEDWKTTAANVDVALEEIIIFGWGIQNSKMMIYMVHSNESNKKTINDLYMNTSINDETMYIYIYNNWI